MHYKLPKTKSEDDEPVKETVTGMDEYEKTVTIPVNDEILDSCKVGDSCHITLVGKITGLHNSESDTSEHKTLTIVISEVDVTMDDDEYAEESFNTGFNRGSHHH